MITYPLSLPTVSGFTEFTWAPISNIAHQVSEFSYHSKVYEWDGQRRQFSARLGNMNQAEFSLWQAFFGKLNGVRGTFLLQDPVAAVHRGEYDHDTGYTPRVKGGSQNGAVMETDGWPEGVDGLLVAGDWISINNRLYQLLEDADSDTNGEASLTVWPHVRTDVADNAIISVGEFAFGEFRLMAFPQVTYDVEHRVKFIVVTGTEAF